MNQYLSITLGMIAAGVVCWMFSEPVSTRIRNSRVWFLGWLGYLFMVSLAARLLSPLFDRIPLSDDQVIPILFGVVVIVLLVVFILEYSRLRRHRKGN
jgi:hypothetical protein